MPSGLEIMRGIRRPWSDEPDDRALLILAIVQALQGLGSMGSNIADWMLRSKEMGFREEEAQRAAAREGREQQRWAWEREDRPRDVEKQKKQLEHGDIELERLKQQRDIDDAVNLMMDLVAEGVDPQHAMQVVRVEKYGGKFPAGVVAGFDEAVTKHISAQLGLGKMRIEQDEVENYNVLQKKYGSPEGFAKSLELEVAANEPEWARLDPPARQQAIWSFISQIMDQALSGSHPYGAVFKGTNDLQRLGHLSKIFDSLSDNPTGKEIRNLVTSYGATLRTKPGMDADAGNLQQSFTDDTFARQNWALAALYGAGGKVKEGETLRAAAPILGLTPESLTLRERELRGNVPGQERSVLERMLQEQLSLVKPDVSNQFVRGGRLAPLGMADEPSRRALLAPTFPQIANPEDFQRRWELGRALGVVKEPPARKTYQTTQYGEPTGLPSEASVTELSADERRYPDTAEGLKRLYEEQEKRLSREELMKALLKLMEKTPEQTQNYMKP